MNDEAVVAGLGIFHVALPDGRVIEVVDDGPKDALTLVYHSGTPVAVSPFPELAKVAAERGLRLVTYSRPGYGDSTAQPGRSVADAAADTSALLDAIGAGDFVTLGWSGGGPHALACGALLSPRCRGVASLAGCAPASADIDWSAGMGEENVEEFGAASAGIEPLTAFLDTQVPALAALTGAQVAAGLGNLVSDVDKAALAGTHADDMALGLRRAISRGIEGWRDDDLAFVKSWGFEVSAVATPVAVWQGAQDRMVPFTHGNWLVANLPDAHDHLMPDEGHLSFISRIDEIVDDLVALAR